MVHGRSQQHVAARSLSFCSERFSLLLDQRRRFVIRRATSGRRLPSGPRFPIDRCGPTAPAVIGSHRQARPERTCIEVEGSLAKTHLAAVVAKAKTASARDRSRLSFATSAAAERNAPSVPSLDQFIGCCRKCHGRLFQDRQRPDPRHSSKAGGRRRLPARNTFDSLRVTIQANTWGIDPHGDGALEQSRRAAAVSRDPARSCRRSCAPSWRARSGPCRPGTDP